MDFPALSRSQIIRVSLAAVVVGIGAWLLVPRLLSDIRANGVVNARLIVVRAPISGLLVREPPDVGTVVNENQILAEVLDEVEAMPLLAQLDTDRDTLYGRVEALRGKLKELAELRERLESQVNSFQTDSVRRLGFVLAEAQARKNAWEAVRTERETNLKRAKDLEASGHIAKARVDAAVSTLEQAVQEVSRAEADTSRVSQEISSLKRGVILGEGRDDVPYSRQRLDDVVMADAELKVQIAESSSRLRAVERQFTDEKARSTKRSSAAVKSPIDGIVWRRFVSINSTVVKDAEIVKLLDCVRLLIEVPVSENRADDIEIGSTVNIRFQGSTKIRQGKVQDVRGQRSIVPRSELVSSAPELKRDEVMVSIVSTPEALDVKPEKFCGVGRRAEVAFPRSF